MATVLVHKSKTRRKACTGCVKAKRRCDLLLPACSRCKSKSLGCIYVNDGPRKESTKSPQSSLLIADPRESIAAAQSFTGPHESGFNIQTYDDNNISVLDYQSRQLDLDYTLWSSDVTSFQPNLPLSIASFPELIDPQILSISMDTLPSPYSSLQYPLRATLSSTQVAYLVTQLKSFVSSFALHSRNSFIHPLSVHNPGKSLSTPYTDALSVCALHTLSSSQTLSILDSKLSNLISSSQKDYWSTHEWLLAVQVFVLYQIICLWSSNERQKLNAERHIPLLMKWTNRLQTEYIGLLAQGIDSGLPAGSSSGKSEIQKNQKRWVLMESIRRTVMISIVLQCLYGGCKDGYIGALLPVLCGLPVSVGAARAWEALGRRVNDEQEYDWEDQSDIDVEPGEIYTYEYWSEGWSLGIVGGRGKRTGNI